MHGHRELAAAILIALETGPDSLVNDHGMTVAISFFVSFISPIPHIVHHIVSEAPDNCDK
jgi:hypothetical protein